MQHAVDPWASFPPELIAGLISGLVTGLVVGLTLFLVQSITARQARRREYRLGWLNARSSVLAALKEDDVIPLARMPTPRAVRMSLAVGHLPIRKWADELRTEELRLMMTALDLRVDRNASVENLKYRMTITPGVTEFEAGVWARVLDPEAEVGEAAVDTLSRLKEDALFVRWLDQARLDIAALASAEEQLKATLESIRRP